MEEVKSLQTEVKDVTDTGVVTIAISKFDVEDYAGDIVRKGAFARSFEDLSRLKHCVDHYSDIEHIVGTPVKAWETQEYAIVESRLILGKSLGHDVFELYKHYAANNIAAEHSYRYCVKKAQPNPDIKGRDIVDLQLVHEYSTVFAGCNPQTPLLGLKGVTTIAQVSEQVKLLDAILRDCDLSDAKGQEIEQTIALLKGMAAALGDRAGIIDPAELLAQLRKSFN